MSIFGSKESKFTYNYAHIEPLATADTVPFSHLPRLAWWKEIARATNTIIDNMSAIKRVTDAEGLPVGNIEGLEEQDDRVEAGLLIDLPKIITDRLDEATVRCVGGRAASLDEYKVLFQELADPEAPDPLNDDGAFAEMRVAGPTPLVLAGVASLPGHFPVKEAHFQAALSDPEDSLAAAEADGRLFVCDYALLSGLPSGTYPRWQKYVTAPLALFVVARAGGALRPVAIQCGQSPAAGPIFTPGDGHAWSMAKAAVTVADANYHEAVSHFARTHMFIEPFVIATERRLPDGHPLHRLLLPHFEGTLYIDNLAISALANPGGGVNKLVGPTGDAARMAMALGALSQPFDKASLPEQLRARGVTDAGILPHYPYRDDAVLVWGAIRSWVHGYLSIHYRGDAEVRGDADLQSWAAELVAFDGGRVHGFGQPPGSIRSLDYLREALTTILFTASAQHAAVNFPQGPMMGDASRCPLAAYAPPPLDTHATKADFLATLPPLEQALRQLNILHLLSSVHHTQLGGYGKGWFHDDRVARPLADFHAALQGIEQTIDARNRERTPYPYLKPSLIPQSINI